MTYSSLNCLVVRNRGIVIRVLERSAEPGETVRPAGDVRLPIEAKRTAQLQMGCRSPIVFNIEAHIICGEGLMKCVRERLRIVGGSALKEVRKGSRSSSSGIGTVEENIQIVAQEVYTRFQCVLALGDGEIIHKLILRDMTADGVGLVLP